MEVDGELACLTLCRTENIRTRDLWVTRCVANALAIALSNPLTICHQHVPACTRRVPPHGNTACSTQHTAPTTSSWAEPSRAYPVLVTVTLAAVRLYATTLPRPVAAVEKDCRLKPGPTTTVPEPKFCMNRCHGVQVRKGAGLVNRGCWWY